MCCKAICNLLQLHVTVVAVYKSVLHVTLARLEIWAYAYDTGLPANASVPSADFARPKAAEYAAVEGRECHCSDWHAALQVVWQACQPWLARRAGHCIALHAIWTDVIGRDLYMYNHTTLLVHSIMLTGS